MGKKREMAEYLVHRKHVFCLIGPKSAPSRQERKRGERKGRAAQTCSQVAFVLAAMFLDLLNHGLAD
jgi:hypothetical protein